MTVTGKEALAPQRASEDVPAVSPQDKGLRNAMSYRTIGAVYILILICIIFSFWAPSTFPTIATVHQVLDSNSIIALAALAILVPLSAGVFDLSMPFIMSLSGCIVAELVQNSGFNVEFAIVIALLVSMAVGVVNGVVVVGWNIDSFIATLATGSLIQALITGITAGVTITSPSLTSAISSIGDRQIVGFTLPVFYTLVTAFCLWAFLEHSPTGRRVYATGFNIDSARLAGVRTERIRFWSFVLSGFIAGVAGIVLASTIEAGDPTAGTPYLLPAFAAVFLGATQFKRGRFNAWGTVLAAILLGVGVTGLGLVNAPAWAGDMFTGVVLIASMAITGKQRKPNARATVWSKVEQRLSALRSNLGRARE